MCGITGFIDFNHYSSEKVLSDMTNTLVHRGPDSGDISFFAKEAAQVGLGHRRLAIIDLSETGKQPMQLDNLWLCFNGEIYNYKEIKNELKVLGHQFIGDSDSEMILHSYREWGKSCLDKFLGMFAFVIFDNERNEIFCARDRAGVKPFHYYWKDGLFMFASELKAFHVHPKFEKIVNLDAVAAFLQYGNVPTPHCIFDYCKKLKPGHSLSFNFQYKELEEKQYWNVYDSYNKKKLKISYEDAISETEIILNSAFNYRMVSDVPVGVFLSGGYDSTCVTALLQKDRTEKLKTFTIGVPDIGLNEAPYAKDIANYLGTDHTEITCTQKEALELIPELPNYFDEPYADSSAIPTTLVSKSARRDVTVALSADAGDEIFAGYNRYEYIERYGKKLNKIPGFVRNSTASLMNVIPSEKIPVLKHKYNFHNRYEKLKQVLRNPSDEYIMLSLSQQFMNNKVQSLFVNNINALDTFYHSKELHTETYSTLSYMQAIDFQTYLVDDILQKVDRATMTASLEGREPFLDHRIIEYVATLPDEYKYHNGIKKRILRDIVHQYVPKNLLDRPKMGFAIPIANWMQNELRELLEEYISEDKIRRQGVLNWSEINKIKMAFLNGKKEYDMKVWYILMFQMWWERWMEN